jgi:signal-transduction protein with cAMP-binding, CBS, and nucleotidyltransferase domain
MKTRLKDVIYTKRLRVSTSLLDNSKAFHKEYRSNLKFKEFCMQIVTTHKNMDFDALASMVAATILYPKAIPVVDNDRIIGILTRSDAMRYFYDLLPD